MSVQQVCERAGMPMETGVERLKAAGLEADASTPVRDLATAQGKTPMDIAKIIAGDAGTVPARGTHAPGSDRR